MLGKLASCGLAAALAANALGQGVSIRIEPRGTNGQVMIKWPLTPGASYLCDYKTDLNSTNWTVIGNLTVVTPLGDTNGAGYYYAETLVKTQMFFRIRRVL